MKFILANKSDVILLAIWFLTLFSNFHTYIHHNLHKTAEKGVEENVNESIAQAFQKHPKAPVMIDVRKNLPLDGITLDSVEQSQPTWQYYVWCRRIILFIFCVTYIEFESYKSENNENTSYRKLKRSHI